MRSVAQQVYFLALLALPNFEGAPELMALTRQEAQQSHQRSPHCQFLKFSHPPDFSWHFSSQLLFSQALLRRYRESVRHWDKDRERDEQLGVQGWRRQT